jgi:hypothetical protein
LFKHISDQFTAMFKCIEDFYFYFLFKLLNNTTFTLPAPYD